MLVSNQAQVIIPMKPHMTLAKRKTFRSGQTAVVQEATGSQPRRVMGRKKELKATQTYTKAYGTKIVSSYLAWQRRQSVEKLLQEESSDNDYEDAKQWVDWKEAKLRGVIVELQHQLGSNVFVPGDFKWSCSSCRNWA